MIHPEGARAVVVSDMQPHQGLIVGFAERVESDQPRGVSNPLQESPR